MRAPVTVCSGVSMTRQPWQAAANPSYSPFTQRRAAPMPRVGEVVSDMVWRVPNPTSLVMAAFSASTLTPWPISVSCG